MESGRQLSTEEAQQYQQKQNRRKEERRRLEKAERAAHKAKETLKQLILRHEHRVSDVSVDASALHTGARYVGRNPVWAAKQAGGTTAFGNHAPNGKVDHRITDVHAIQQEYKRAVRAYTMWIVQPEQTELRVRIRKTLAGHRLACHCNGIRADGRVPDFTQQQGDRPCSVCGVRGCYKAHHFLECHGKVVAAIANCSAEELQQLAALTASGIRKAELTEQQITQALRADTNGHERCAVCWSRTGDIDIGESQHACEGCFALLQA